MDTPVDRFVLDGEPEDHIPPRPGESLERQTIEGTGQVGLYDPFAESDGAWLTFDPDSAVEMSDSVLDRKL